MSFFVLFYLEFLNVLILILLHSHRYGFILNSSVNNGIRPPSTDSSFTRKLFKSTKARAPEIVDQGQPSNIKRESNREMKWYNMGERRVDERTNQIYYHFEKTPKVTHAHIL